MIKWFTYIPWYDIITIFLYSFTIVHVQKTIILLFGRLLALEWLQIKASVFRCKSIGSCQLWASEVIRGHSHRDVQMRGHEHLSWRLLRSGADRRCRQSDIMTRAREKISAPDGRDVHILYFNRRFFFVQRRIMGRSVSENHGFSLIPWCNAI